MSYQLVETAVLKLGVDGRGVLLNTANGAVFKLNKTCACVCNKLKQGPCEFEQIMDELRQIMEVPEQANDDIRAYLDTLAKKGLLKG